MSGMAGYPGLRYLNMANIPISGYLDTPYGVDIPISGYPGHPVGGPGSHLRYLCYHMLLFVGH
jgi:hypothetical protein